MKQKQIDALDLLLDDHFALWDFADSLPEFRPDAVNSAVADLVDLVHRGFVVVEFGTWFDNKTEPVSQTVAERVLTDAANWKPNGPEPGYVVTLTDKGAEHLRGLGFGET